MLVNSLVDPVFRKWLATLNLDDITATTFLQSDGSIDLTEDWTISANSITLTAGTLTANKGRFDQGLWCNGTTGSIPISGAGTRLMWIPNKGAFRVGQVDDTQWDVGSIGDSSFAAGKDTTASGDYSVAMGDRTTASAAYSVAMGLITTASLTGSTAFGNRTTASAIYSTAFGGRTTASGNYSTAFGRYTDAESYMSVAIGRYNIGGGTYDSWVATDPLFEIGIGTADAARANALTILKNANATFAGTLGAGAGTFTAAITGATGVLTVRNTNAYAAPWTQFSQVWLDSDGAVMAYIRNDGSFAMGGTQGLMRPKAIESYGGGNLNVFSEMRFNAAHILRFRDDNTYIYSAAAGYMDIGAVTAVRIASDLDVSGDTYWVGSGSGLPFGCILSDTPTDIALAAQDTWYQIVAFDTDKSENVLDADHTNDHITITKTGIYKITLTACVYSAASNDYQLRVRKNNGATNLHPHLYQTTAVAGQIENIAGVCHESLTADDTIEVWVLRTDGGAVAKTLTTAHISLNTTMIGG